MNKPTGELSLVFSRKDNGRTHLSRQYFKLPLQIMMPHYQEEDGTAFVYFLNPGGGVLQHDRLLTEVTVEDGADVFITTPSSSSMARIKRFAAAHSAGFGQEPGTHAGMVSARTSQTSSAFPLRIRLRPCTNPADAKRASSADQARAEQGPACIRREPIANPVLAKRWPSENPSPSQHRPDSIPPPASCESPRRPSARPAASVRAKRL